MAHRFHCEQCGKRLQVDLMPGARVMCPHCRNTQIVPADAALVTSAPATSPVAEDPSDNVSHTDGLVAVAAAYIPSWGTSVVLHLAVGLVALMSAWVAVKAPPEPLNLEAKFVRAPTAKIEHKVTSSASRSWHKVQSKEFSSFVDKPTVNPFPDLENNNRNPVLTIGLDGDSGGDKRGGISGIGDFRGVPNGPGTGGWFPRDAHRQVFVIDRSGSMTDSIMYVKYELKRTIRAMTPSDQFHIIFYSTGPAVEMPTMKLLPATNSNKLLAFDFIDGIVPVGGTDPSEALKAAFKLKPEVIHLLSDGEFESKILGLIDKFNARKEVRVNTLCFLYPGGGAALESIAARNGGSYKFIRDEDLTQLAD